MMPECNIETSKYLSKIVYANIFLHVTIELLTTISIITP